MEILGIDVGGGVSKKFSEFKTYLDLDTEVVSAESRNHAGIIVAALAASAKHGLSMTNTH